MGDSDIQYRTSISAPREKYLPDFNVNNFRAKGGNGQAHGPNPGRYCREASSEDAVEVAGQDGRIQLVASLVGQPDVILQQDRIRKALL